jgi:hypothetical protein
VPWPLSEAPRHFPFLPVANHGIRVTRNRAPGPPCARAMRPAPCRSAQIRKSGRRGRAAALVCARWENLSVGRAVEPLGTLNRGGQGRRVGSAGRYCVGRIPGRRKSVLCELPVEKDVSCPGLAGREYVAGVASSAPSKLARNAGHHALDACKVSSRMSSPQLLASPVCAQPEWTCLGVLPGQHTEVLQKAFPAWSAV